MVITELLLVQGVLDIIAEGEADVTLLLEHLVDLGEGLVGLHVFLSGAGLSLALHQVHSHQVEGLQHLGVVSAAVFSEDLLGGLEVTVPLDVALGHCLGEQWTSVLGAFDVYGLVMDVSMFVFGPYDLSEYILTVILLGRPDLRSDHLWLDSVSLVLADPSQ